MKKIALCTLALAAVLSFAGSASAQMIKKPSVDQTCQADITGDGWYEFAKRRYIRIIGDAVQYAGCGGGSNGGSIDDEGYVRWNRGALDGHRCMIVKLSGRKYTMTPIACRA